LVERPVRIDEKGATDQQTTTNPFHRQPHFHPCTPAPARMMDTTSSTHPRPTMYSRGMKCTVCHAATHSRHVRMRNDEARKSRHCFVMKTLTSQKGRLVTTGCSQRGAERSQWYVTVEPAKRKALPMKKKK
jgi:hypothetical protein